MKRLPLYLVILWATLLVLTACATTGPSEDQQTQLAEQLAIQYAVLKVGENNPAKLRKIGAIAHDAKSWLISDTATIDALEAVVRSKIDWSKLDPANALLVNALLSEIDLQLRSRVSTGILTADQKVKVNQVLDWVIAITG